MLMIGDKEARPLNKETTQRMTRKTFFFIETIWKEEERELINSFNSWVEVEIREKASSLGEVREKRKRSWRRKKNKKERHNIIELSKNILMLAPRIKI